MAEEWKWLISMRIPLEMRKDGKRRTIERPTGRKVDEHPHRQIKMNTCDDLELGRALIGLKSFVHCEERAAAA